MGIESKDTSILNMGQSSLYRTIDFGSWCGYFVMVFSPFSVIIFNQPQNRRRRYISYERAVGLLC